MFSFYFLFVFVLFFGLAVSSPTKQLEETRIVGGHDIDITQAPYQVSLLNRGRHSCGGSIIAEDIVVTAAHCVLGSQAQNFQVRVGSSSSKEGGKIIDVADLSWHQGFTYSKMDYDVAILLLKDPLEFDEKVAPIDITEKDYEIEDGEMTLITGWGSLREGGAAPATLQSVTVPAVSNEACSEAYSPYYSITPRMLCAGTTSGGKDACQGDSGGPLVHDGKLSGIVSWGIGCARPDYPGVYAKVSALREWIDENTDFLRVKKILRGF